MTQGVFRGEKGLEETPVWGQLGVLIREMAIKRDSKIIEEAVAVPHTTRGNLAVWWLKSKKEHRKQKFARRKKNFGESK